MDISIRRMLGFRSRGEGSPAFEAAPLDIRDPSFASVAVANNFSLGGSTSSDPTPRGNRIRDIYLNDPELQKIYPLGLLPLGQLHFFSWLTNHGRRDQQLTDAEILEFLSESAADELRGLIVTYLLQPGWQQHFPDALTASGWIKFRTWVHATYSEHLRAPLPEIAPLAVPDLRRAEGVNILGHFCNPSG